MKKDWKINLILFFLLTILVIFMQYDLLRPTLEIGLSPDDWSFIFWYKLLGHNPWSKIAEVWVVRGPYTTVPLFYMGFINSLVGFDFFKMQIVSIVFKTFATLVLFPLILIVFKNRLLAFLTTILFAMSYPSAGALETAVEPTEYLGIFFMGLFLITYYYLIKNNILTWKNLGLATILLIITIIFSIMRLYPLIVLIILVETYLLIQKHSLAALRISFLRLFILYLPFIAVTLYRPKVILSYIGTVPIVLHKVIEGNWHFVLTPLQGIGYTLPFSARWSILGLLNVNTFKEYFYFILGGPSIIFGLTILFLAFFSLKPWRFFLRAFCLNFILELLVFFIARHYLYIPLETRMNFDAPRIYSTLFGLFILTLTFTYWTFWQTENRTKLFLALWIGPAVSFIFIVLTWMLADINLGFGGAQDHYLLIPSAGISLLIAGLLVLIYQKSEKMKLVLFKIVIIGLIFGILTSFYFLNRNLIYSYFNHVNANGRAAEGQRIIQKRFRDKIKNVNLSNQALFYFDTSQIKGDGPFYTEGLLSSLPFFIRFQGNNIIDGCSGVFYESKQKLAQLIQDQNGERGFVYRALCVKNGIGDYDNLFYKPEDFYAFRLKDKDMVDIKEEVLEELGL